MTTKSFRKGTAEVSVKDRIPVSTVKEIEVDDVDLLEVVVALPAASVLELGVEARGKQDLVVERDELSVAGEHLVVDVHRFENSERCLDHRRNDQNGPSTDDHHPLLLSGYAFPNLDRRLREPSYHVTLV